MDRVLHDLPFMYFLFFQSSFLFPKISNLHRTGNLTSVSEFFLLGLSDDPKLEPLLCVLFLSMYLVTVLGNLLIILAITSDPRLHTPMYFFLSNLSLADISFNTTTVPKMLVNLQTHNKSITYAGCLAGVTVFSLFACLESLLLTVMPMTSWWPSVTPYTTCSSWTPASVASWSWCHFPSDFWTPSFTTWWCHSLPLYRSGNASFLLWPF